MTKNGRARTGLNHGGKFNEDHQLLLFFPTLLEQQLQLLKYQSEITAT
jgi:hypothetical protein